MAYTECHAVRGHSVVLLHRLLDVYLSLPQTLYSLGQSLTSKYQIGTKYLKLTFATN